jgi:hypothetical protein
MTTKVETNLDFSSVARIIGLPQATLAGHPVVFEQLQTAIEGLAWKDDVRASSGSANINLAAPGAAIGGVTMVALDRFIARGQTATAENGIYIWNGAAAAATRALDMSSSLEFNSAVVPVTEGAEAGTRWRQTVANPTVGTTGIVFVSDQASAPAASEITAGIAEIATQAETDAGTDDLRIVTPLKLATYANRAKRFSVTIGDAAATQFTITHNLGTTDIHVTIRDAAGVFGMVIADWEATTINTAIVRFASAPALNSRRVTVLA